MPPPHPVRRTIRAPAAATARVRRCRGKARARWRPVPPDPCDVCQPPLSGDARRLQALAAPAVRRVGPRDPANPRHQRCRGGAEVRSRPRTRDLQDVPRPASSVSWTPTTRPAGRGRRCSRCTSTTAGSTCGTRGCPAWNCPPRRGGVRRCRRRATVFGQAVERARHSVEVGLSYAQYGVLGPARERPLAERHSDVFGAQGWQGVDGSPRPRRRSVVAAPVDDQPALLAREPGAFAPNPTVNSALRGPGSVLRAAA